MVTTNSPPPSSNEPYNATNFFLIGDDIYLFKSLKFLKLLLHAMVGEYINTMKTTFDFNLDLYQAVKQDGYT